VHAPDFRDKLPKRGLHVHALGTAPGDARRHARCHGQLHGHANRANTERLAQ
jgi:hypothetical protein